MIATPLEGKGKYVTLSSDKEQYKKGETATFYAKVVDREFFPFGKGPVYVAITDASGRSERVAMEVTDAKRGMYQAKYRIPAAGVYRVQSAVPVLGEEGFQAAIKFSAESVSVEENSLQMKKEVLEGISARTGATFHTIETADEIPGEISAPERAFVEVKRRSLWDSYYALIAFVGIMTLEWVLRKRKGYV
jgi:hypothetical protein